MPVEGCRQCGSNQFGHDVVGWVAYCESCGMVQKNAGVFLSEMNGGSQCTGSVVAAFVADEPCGVGQAVHQSVNSGAASKTAETNDQRFHKATKRVSAEVRQAAGRLALSQGIWQEAEQLLRRSFATFDRTRERMPRKGLAPALLYLACRVQQFPILVAEVAPLAGMEPCAMFRMVHMLAARLSMALPPLDVRTYMQRALGRLPARSSVPDLERLEREALQLVDWWEGNEEGLGTTPLGAAAAALLLAAEAQQGALTTELVARELGLSPPTVSRQARLMRGGLLRIAASCPWMSAVTEKTVGLHLATLLRVDALARKGPPPLAGVLGADPGHSNAPSASPPGAQLAAVCENPRRSTARPPERVPACAPSAGPAPVMAGGLACSDVAAPQAVATHPVDSIGCLGEQVHGHGHEDSVACLGEQAHGHVHEDSVACLGEQVHGHVHEDSIGCLGEQVHGHAHEASVACLGEHVHGHAHENSIGCLDEQVHGHVHEDSDAAISSAGHALACEMPAAAAAAGSCGSPTPDQTSCPGVTSSYSERLRNTLGGALCRAPLGVPRIAEAPSPVQPNGATLHTLPREGMQGHICQSASAAAGGGATSTECRPPLGGPRVTQAPSPVQPNGANLHTLPQKSLQGHIRQSAAAAAAVGHARSKQTDLLSVPTSPPTARGGSGAAHLTPAAQVGPSGPPPRTGGKQRKRANCNVFAPMTTDARNVHAKGGAAEEVETGDGMLVADSRSGRCEPEGVGAGLVVPCTELRVPHTEAGVSAGGTFVSDREAVLPQKGLAGPRAQICLPSTKAGLPSLEALAAHVKTSQGKTSMPSSSQKV